MERQRDFYHKCHRCEFCGKPADFTLPSTNGRVSPAAPQGERVVEAPPARNGVVAPRDTKDLRNDIPTPEFREATTDASQGT